MAELNYEKIQKFHNMIKEKIIDYLNSSIQEDQSLKSNKYMDVMNDICRTYNIDFENNEDEETKQNMREEIKDKDNYELILFSSTPDGTPDVCQFRHTSTNKMVNTRR